jgi:hypothetical protein
LFASDQKRYARPAKSRKIKHIRLKPQQNVGVMIKLLYMLLRTRFFHGRNAVTRELERIGFCWTYLGSDFAGFLSLSFI